MARARNIKPALFENEDLGDADPMLTLLFIGLWTLADREGKLEDRPKRIKAQLFPYREGLDINGALTELASLGFICRYTRENRSIIRVINFEKHQSPHKTEKASELPDEPENFHENNRIQNAPLNNGSCTVKESLIPYSLIPDSLIPEGKHFVDSDESTVQKLTKTALISNPDPPDPWPDQFDEFWLAFDHKSGKQAALRAWTKIPKRDRDLPAILAGARAEAERRRRLPPDRTPKMAQGWLSERRWQDEIYTEPSTASSPEQSQAERVAARIKARENLKVINE